MEADGELRRIPRTHDISVAGEHIPTIGDLAARLEEAVHAVWPRRHSSRYAIVQVLLLRWRDDDLGVARKIRDLHQIFKDAYQFEVQVYEIPSMKPDRALKKRLYDFLEQAKESREDVLLIVHYGGHAKRALQSNDLPIWVA